MSKLEQIQALRHARVARNSSRGGGEARATAQRPAGTRDRPATTVQSDVTRAAPDNANSSGKIVEARVRKDAGVATGPRETKPKRKAKAKKPKPAKAPKVKIGRPRVEDRGKTLSDRKPWLEAKPPMSRATWYRRQAK